MILRFTFFIASCLMSPATAQSSFSHIQCDDSTRLIAMMTDVIGATKQGTGLRDPDTTLDIWVMDASDEWMIVQNYANGTSCIVAMGEYWEATMTGPS